MSTPVQTEKWAGNFDCDFCRRKRLMGDAFSRKALERYRVSGGKLKCKECVEKAEEAERAAAAAKRKNQNKDTGATEINTETRACALCEKVLAFGSFNRNQWSKGEGNSKCRDCVDQSIAAEKANQEQSKQEKIQQARRSVEAAINKGNNAAEILKAESELAALEAEQVTGLKPIKLKSSSSRGGGGRVGRSGRGRSGGGRGR